jgi:hypothetical protein
MSCGNPFGNFFRMEKSADKTGRDSEQDFSPFTKKIECFQKAFLLGAGSSSAQKYSDVQRKSIS